MLHIGIADNIARVNTRQNATLRASVTLTRAESFVPVLAMVAAVAFIAAMFI